MALYLFVPTRADGAPEKPQSHDLASEREAFDLARKILRQVRSATSVGIVRDGRAVGFVPAAPSRAPSALQGQIDSSRQLIDESLRLLERTRPGRPGP